MFVYILFQVATLVIYYLLFTLKNIYYFDLNIPYFTSTQMHNSTRDSQHGLQDAHISM